MGNEEKRMSNKPFYSCLMPHALCLIPRPHQYTTLPYVFQRGGSFRACLSRYRTALPLREKDRRLQGRRPVSGVEPAICRGLVPVELLQVERL